MLPERTAQIAGFRYFNVYGPREAHKGRMASVALHFFDEYRAEGRVRLFEGSGGYAAGEQRRDFVFVDDVVAAKLDFLDHPERSGIFNLGTGTRASFNDVAVATINACRKAEGKAAGDARRARRRRRDRVRAVPAGARRQVPELHRGGPRPRCATPATRRRSRAVEEGVARYVERLISQLPAPP